MSGPDLSQNRGPGARTQTIGTHNNFDIYNRPNNGNNFNTQRPKVDNLINNQNFQPQGRTQLIGSPQHLQNTQNTQNTQRQIQQLDNNVNQTMPGPYNPQHQTMNHSSNIYDQHRDQNNSVHRNQGMGMGIDMSSNNGNRLGIPQSQIIPQNGAGRGQLSIKDRLENVEMYMKSLPDLMSKNIETMFVDFRKDVVDNTSPDLTTNSSFGVFEQSLLNISGNIDQIVTMNTESKTEDILGQIVETLNKIDDKVDIQDKRNVIIDERIKQIDDRSKQIDERTKDLDDRSKQIEEQIKSSDNNEELSHYMKLISKMNEISDAQQSIKSRLDQMERTDQSNTDYDSKIEMNDIKTLIQHEINNMYDKFKDEMLKSLIDYINSYFSAVYTEVQTLRAELVGTPISSNFPISQNPSLSLESMDSHINQRNSQNENTTKSQIKDHNKNEGNNGDSRLQDREPDRSRDREPDRSRDRESDRIQAVDHDSMDDSCDDKSNDKTRSRVIPNRAHHQRRTIKDIKSKPH